MHQPPPEADQFGPPSASPSRMLHTTAGDFPLLECRLQVGGREWSVRYTAAVLTRADEDHYLTDLVGRMPYGVVLWPAAIALAHEVATRPAEFTGRPVLELGAGTGLPGIVAASLGARVVQTDRQELAMAVCRQNGERNGVGGIEYRLVDWAEWDDPVRYDWIIGSDILYADSLHAPLRRIFESSLAPGGRVLLADPFRADSFHLLDALEAAGWSVRLTRWTIGEGDSARKIGVYELAPPRGGKSGS